MTSSIASPSTDVSTTCKGTTRAIQDTLEVVGGKWRIVILAALHERPYRFGELAKQIGITPRMLSRELQDLEMNRLVDRTVLHTKPISVEYAMSEYGQSLGSVIMALKEWGENHRRIIFDNA